MAPETINPTNDYANLNCNIVWPQAINSVHGKWVMHDIGSGHGDWPHGTLVAPVLPGGRLGLILGYHSAFWKGHFPEIFEVSADPKKGPWPKRVLPEIKYGESLQPVI
jgi:hypothetical protein